MRATPFTCFVHRIADEMSRITVFYQPIMKKGKKQGAFERKGDLHECLLGKDKNEKYVRKELTLKIKRL